MSAQFLSSKMEQMVKEGAEQMVREGAKQMAKEGVEVVVTPVGTDHTFVAVICAIIVVLITVAFFLFRALKDKADTFLMVGLSDAGKTHIFGKLANRNLEPVTYTSFQENVLDVDIKGKHMKVVDFPGAERLRKHLIEKWLKKVELRPADGILRGTITYRHFNKLQNHPHRQSFLSFKERSSLRGIAFVVDSSSFSKRSRDVAEFLYDVALESGKKVPILVACNKQDHGLAKSSQVIRSSLEKEIGMINKTRAAALTTTDGSSFRHTLTDTGGNFAWEDLPRSVEFVECCAVDGASVGLEAVRSFITV